MVNQPGKPAGSGRFAAPEGGEEVANYEELLDAYGTQKFAEGEVMQGTVLKITDTDVVVDVHRTVLHSEPGRADRGIGPRQR